MQGESYQGGVWDEEIFRLVRKEDMLGKRTGKRIKWLEQKRKCFPPNFSVKEFNALILVKTYEQEH